jgi:Domain of Unknown Function (DUF928)
MRQLIDILDLAWRSKLTKFSGAFFSLLFLSVIYGNDLTAIAQPKYSQYGLGTAKKYVGGVPHSIPSYCISIISPDDGGRTISERPSLYVYIYKLKDKWTPYKSLVNLDFIMREDNHRSRRVFTGKERIFGEGFYKIKLPVSNPSILNGKIQHWSVYVTSEGIDTDRSVAYIQREPDINLEREFNREHTLFGKARIYAKYFYWYDAFDAYTQWLEINPTDQVARRERAKLLQENQHNQCIDYQYISSEKLLELIDAKPAKPIAFPQRQ